ncbi:MAG: hypothetical protein AAGE61_04675 [Pseudomonadota bacterium]
MSEFNIPAGFEGLISQDPRTEDPNRLDELDFEKYFEDQERERKKIKTPEWIRLHKAIYRSKPDPVGEGPEYGPAERAVGSILFSLYTKNGLPTDKVERQLFIDLSGGAEKQAEAIVEAAKYSPPDRFSTETFKEYGMSQEAAEVAQALAIDLISDGFHPAVAWTAVWQTFAKGASTGGFTGGVVSLIEELRDRGNKVPETIARQYQVVDGVAPGFSNVEPLVSPGQGILISKKLPSQLKEAAEFEIKLADGRALSTTIALQSGEKAYFANGEDRQFIKLEQTGEIFDITGTSLFSARLLSVEYDAFGNPAYLINDNLPPFEPVADIRLSPEADVPGTPYDANSSDVLSKLIDSGADIDVVTLADGTRARTFVKTDSDGHQTASLVALELNGEEFVFDRLNSHQPKLPRSVVIRNDDGLPVIAALSDLTRADTGESLATIFRPGDVTRQEIEGGASVLYGENGDGEKYALSLSRSGEPQLFRTDGGYPRTLIEDIFEIRNRWSPSDTGDGDSASLLNPEDVQKASLLNEVNGDTSP